MRYYHRFQHINHYNDFYIDYSNPIYLWTNNDKSVSQFQGTIRVEKSGYIQASVHINENPGTPFIRIVVGNTTICENFFSKTTHSYLYMTSPLFFIKAGTDVFFFIDSGDEYPANCNLQIKEYI